MIIEALKALLEADAAVFGFVADRVYPVELPDAPTFPALVLTKVNGRSNYDMQGDAGVVGDRVQVDVFDDGGASHCIQVKKAVKRLLSGYRGGPFSDAPCQIQASFCINDFDLTEPGMERAGPRVRRRTLEFTIWSQEA